MQTRQNRSRTCTVLSWMLYSTFVSPVFITELFMCLNNVFLIIVATFRHGSPPPNMRESTILGALFLYVFAYDEGFVAVRKDTANIRLYFIFSLAWVLLFFFIAIL